MSVDTSKTGAAPPDTAALLAQLIAAQQPRTPPAAPPLAAPPQPRTRSTRRTIGALLGEVLAYLAGLALAAGGWVLGGYLTLAALTALGLPVAPVVNWPHQLTTAQLAAWCIPLGISAVEIRWGGAGGWRFGVFGIVALVDAASTYYGATVYAAGRFVPLGPGLTIPTAGGWLIAVGVLAGLVFTFGPERLAGAMLRGLRDVWQR